MVRWASTKPTGALILNDGTIFKGFGFEQQVNLLVKYVLIQLYPVTKK